MIQWQEWTLSLGNVANSLQYTVASPVSQQPMTPAILSAITSPALHTPGGAAAQQAGGNATAATAQATAAGGQLSAAAAYPYPHLPPIDMSSVAAGLVDWSGLTYTLPAGMYAL
jgi:hypothetical protein